MLTIDELVAMILKAKENKQSLVLKDVEVVNGGLRNGKIQLKLEDYKIILDKVKKGIHKE